MCGATFPWHRVLLKHPGAAPAAGGVGGWFGGLTADPGKWHCAHTTAFDGSVSTWVIPSEFLHGFTGCGALTEWHDWQAFVENPPLKSVPWQSWQDTKPPPVESWAIFALAPWLPDNAHPGTGLWWQSVVIQDGMLLPTRATVISWHSLQPLREFGDSAFPGCRATQFAGWKCPFWLGPAPLV